MNCLHKVLIVGATMIVVSFSGCVVAPGYGPNYAYGTPPSYLSPVVVQGRGYGYWYGGNYWGYRNGYSFYNGRYYHNNVGYGYRRGYGGYRGY